MSVVQSEIEESVDFQRVQRVRHVEKRPNWSPHAPLKLQCHLYALQVSDVLCKQCCSSQNVTCNLQCEHMLMEVMSMQVWEPYSKMPEIPLQTCHPIKSTGICSELHDWVPACFSASARHVLRSSGLAKWPAHRIISTGSHSLSWLSCKPEHLYLHTKKHIPNIDCTQFHWYELHSDQWKPQLNAEQHVLCTVTQHAKLRLCTCTEARLTIPIKYCAEMIASCEVTRLLWTLASKTRLVGRL